MSIMASLRQLRYPKEFRIAAPRWPDLSKTLDDLVNLLESSEYSNKAGFEEGNESLNLLIELGTVIWRLRLRLTREGEVNDKIDRTFRDLESAWDTLRQGGIEVRDHTGEEYDGGMALKVLAFQPMTGFTGDKIIQTIKPTIYHNNKLVQKGEVMVGVPEKDTDTNV